jgi:hypothetical protein
MSSITVYTFERPGDGEDTFTTQDPAEARDRGSAYGLRVIANEYEWAGSELAWDFIDDSSDDSEGTRS